MQIKNLFIWMILHQNRFESVEVETKGNSLYQIFAICGTQL